MLHLGEVPSNSINASSTNASGGHNSTGPKGFTSEAPLRCLLSLEGITREKARTLETDLRSVLVLKFSHSFFVSAYVHIGIASNFAYQVKKKRRGSFKDFLAEPMRMIRDAREQAETLQRVQGSNFILQKACPEIDNVKTAIFRFETVLF